MTRETGQIEGQTKFPQSSFYGVLLYVLKDSIKLGSSFSFWLGDPTGETCLIHKIVSEGPLHTRKNKRNDSQHFFYTLREHVLNYRKLKLSDAKVLSIALC